MFFLNQSNPNKKVTLISFLLGWGSGRGFLDSFWNGHKSILIGLIIFEFKKKQEFQPSHKYSVPRPFIIPSMKVKKINPQVFFLTTSHSPRRLLSLRKSILIQSAINCSPVFTRLLYRRIEGGANVVGSGGPRKGHIVSLGTIPRKLFT